MTVVAEYPLQTRPGMPLSDGTLEQRRYYCQNWRADVVAVLSEAGVQDERVAYSAYGVPFGMPAGDTDADGDFDTNDQGAIAFWEMMSIYDVRGDVNLDGSVTSADSAAATTETLGWEVLSGIDSRKGYAGYEHAPELAGTSYHVRYRVLKADLGRWLRRDPLGYVDGMSLYSYAGGLPLVSLDALGTDSADAVAESIFSFPHGERGAYFDIELICKGKPFRIKGYGRVDKVMGGLKGLKKFCRLKRFSYSAHHVVGTGSWSCDDQSDIVSDDDFVASLPRLVDGARLDLDSCNSCGLAEQIKARNPNAKNVEIGCTDGTNYDHPGLGIDATRLVGWWEKDGKNSKVKSGSSGSRGGSASKEPPVCPTDYEQPDEEDEDEGPFGPFDWSELPEPKAPLPDRTLPLPGDSHPFNPPYIAGR